MRYIKNFPYILIWESILRQDLCLIIANIFLFGRNGLPLLKLIRSLTPVPIMILTNNADTESILKTDALQEAEADEFITSPIDWEECIIRCHVLIRQSTELNLLDYKRNFNFAFANGLIVDPHRHTVEFHEQCIWLRKRNLIFYIYWQQTQTSFLRRTKSINIFRISSTSILITASPVISAGFGRNSDG